MLRVIFGFLYGPYPGHTRLTSPRILAAALAAAETGNGQPLWDLHKADVEQLQCHCTSPDLPPLYKMGDATAAISCSDGEAVHETLDGLQAIYDEMAEDSIFAPLWGGRMRCA